MSEDSITPDVEQPEESDVEEQQALSRDDEVPEDNGAPWIELPFGLNVRVFALSLGGLIALLLCLGVLFIPPLSLASRLLSLGYTTLNPDNPVVEHPDGIRLRLDGKDALRVKLNTVPREVFLQEEAGQEWADALQALPPYLTLKGPIYQINKRGKGKAIAELAIPNDAQPYKTLDLYSWDEEIGEWVFVPGHLDEATGVLRTRALPPNVAVFQVEAITPLISTMLETGQIPTPEVLGALNMLMPTGLRLRADGALEGTLIGGWELGQGYAVLPVVRNVDTVTLGAVLGDPDILTLHREDLVAFVVEDGYDGVTIDYQGLSQGDSETFTQFITDLAAGLHAENKLLSIALPRPLGVPGAWDPGAYDWRQIGAAADIVLISPGARPGDYAADGAALDLLAWTTGEVSRVKLHMQTSALSVDEFSGVMIPITYEQALEPLGQVTIDTIVPEGSDGYRPGEELAFRLNGSVAEVTPDQTTGAYYYSLSTSDGEHRIWIVTAASLRARLDIVSTYHIGGMSIQHLMADGQDAGVLTGVTEFKVQQASSVPSQLLLSWNVSSASGAVLDTSTELGMPLLWSAADVGEYTVNARILGGRVSDRGSVTVNIEPEETPEPTPTDRPTPIPGGSGGGPLPEETAPPATEPPPAPAPAGGAGADGGGFQLGGQVPGSLGHAGEMQRAGMTWVKFQVPWSPGMDPGAAAAGFINGGHSAGFKVLLSIPGLQKYPSSIDFNSYVNFVGGVAALGPDAIEVWNEQNIDFEWPAGRIDPASYVNNMLAPAFNAIKGANSSVMVIIGALAPTGFDNGTNAWSDARYVQGMAAAGAANYANCVGVHHNAGATSPSATSGHPGGEHYSWYFLPTLDVYYGGLGGALPVCFTEFGYLTGEGLGAVPGNFSWASDNTLAEQAAWLAEGVQIARSRGSVRLMVIWNVDFTNWGADPQAGYAIVRPDGSCPACDTLGAAMR